MLQNLFLQIFNEEIIKKLKICLTKENIPLKPD